MFTDVLCSNCANAIFNETWGEWRCCKRGVTIHNVLDANFCKAYIEKEKEKKT